MPTRSNQKFGNPAISRGLFYNKQIAKIKEGKPQRFWSKRLSRIAERCNRQRRDALNNAAKLAIDRCLENRMSRIVFG